MKRQRANPETVAAASITDVAALTPGVTLVRVQTGKWKNRFGGWMQGAPAGTPDLMGQLHERALAVETKTELGKLNEAQERFRDEWVRNGGLWILARTPEDFLRGVGR